MIGKNNPLNIRYNPCNHWKGQNGQRKGFCNFKHVSFCIRAAIVILCSYKKRDVFTYTQIIEEWAPSKENPTSSYCFYITDKCKVLPFDKPVTIEDLATLFYYMWCFEQGKSPNLSIADLESMIDGIFSDNYSLYLSWKS